MLCRFSCCNKFCLQGQKIQSCTTLLAYKGSYLREQQAMKCEICKTIERLGLDDSAHDLWHCADAGLVRTTVRQSRGFLYQVGTQVRGFFRSHCPHYRMLAMAFHRRAL